MQETLNECKQVLDYCASQEDAIITYQASNMVLAIHSDEGYLNKRKLQSWTGWHFYMSSDVIYTPNNGIILNIAKVINAIVASATEAELGALFINTQESIHLWHILSKLGHTQPKTLSKLIIQWRKV